MKETTQAPAIAQTAVGWRRIDDFSAGDSCWGPVLVFVVVPSLGRYWCSVGFHGRGGAR